MSLRSFLHTVKWFCVLLYNSHNLTSVICLHTVFSIWPIHRTLSGASTPGQSGPGSNSNEEVLHVSQISKAGASPSDNLVSYPGHSLAGGGSYPSTEMQSVCSTAPADWAVKQKRTIKIIFKFENNQSNEMLLKNPIFLHKQKLIPECS